ncbi:MAG TPA: hypothetical protein VGF25_14290 [Thermoleophilaceae bacterium]
MSRVVDAMLGHLSRSGFDREYGRKMVHELERAGLEHVLARMDDPDTVFLSPPLIAAWGRRPEARGWRRDGRADDRGERRRAVH